MDVCPDPNMRAELVLLLLLKLKRAIENGGIVFVDSRGLDITLSIFLEGIQMFSKACSGSCK